MADIIFEVTLKDNGDNLSRVLDNVDNIYPGRPIATVTKKQWVQRKMKRRFIEDITEYEAGSAAYSAAEIEKAKPEPELESD
jgi:hypothetical protein